jgi:hypothetical protein
MRRKNRWMQYSSLEVVGLLSGSTPLKCGFRFPSPVGRKSCKAWLHPWGY